MKVLVKTDKEGSEMKILTQSQSTQLVRFSRNNAADKLTQYEGTSPYHLNYCGYESCPAGYAFGPHQRSSYLIHLVTKGYGSYYTENGKHIVKEGQMFLIYPEEVTTYTASEDDPWFYYWIGFNGYQAGYILEQMGFSKDKLVIDVTNVSDLVSCIEQMFAASKDTFGNELERTSALLKFFATVINDQPNTGSNETKSFAEYAEYTMRYISNHFDQDIHITDIAEEIGIDRSYLSKSFTHQYNMSPQEYLIRLRMEHAGTLLANTSLSITEVSVRCGYTDVFAFSKMFRKRMGSSPRDYRNERKNK